jgi:high-affinity nickel permease
MTSYALQALGTGLLATFNTSTPSWQHYVFVFPFGVGFGGCITLLLIALISSVSVEGLKLCELFLIVDQATATGMSYLFRSTGSVVGITTTQCVLQNLLKTWLTQRIHGPDAEYVKSLTNL